MKGGERNSCTRSRNGRGLDKGEDGKRGGKER